MLSKDYWELFEETGAPELWLIRWKANGKTGTNHVVPRTRRSKPCAAGWKNSAGTTTARSWSFKKEK